MQSLDDTSDRIIILSFIILMFIAIQSPSDLTGKRIGTLNDIEVEIHTSQEAYVLGEKFTANVFLVNNDSEDIWIEDIPFYEITAVSLNDPTPLRHWVDVTSADALLHIPANSSVKFEKIYCNPKYPGEFRIICIGGKKTVLIIESKFENATVNAMMNKYSFKQTDDAKLFITNLGLNTITVGDKYEIQKKEGDSWIVMPSIIHHPNIWLMYAGILDPGNFVPQEIMIDLLEAGHYRISKEVHSDTSPREHIVTLIVEFEIQGVVDEKYNISWMEAVGIAAEAAEPMEWVEFDANIRYLDELLDDTPVEKDVWVVNLYRTPRKAGSGAFLQVIIDPYNGTVYFSGLLAWISTP